MTATELVSLLSSDEVEVPTEAVAKPVVLSLPRPAVWQRLLLLIAVTLLGLFSLCAVAVALVLGNVVDLTLIQRHRIGPAIHQPLPPATLLLDPQTFAAALARQPDEAGRLHLIRASALNMAQRYEEAADAYAAAAKTRIGLPPAQRLRWAELLFGLGRISEAHMVLLGIPTADMDEKYRARIAALAGRCLLSQREPQN
jgi:hypothetical protein